MAGMNCRPFFLTFVTVALLINAMAASHASAKEKHFEQLRVLLIADAAKCTSCHEQADGKALNIYGKALEALGKDEGLADRILRLEAEPPLEAKPAERKRIEKNHDIDADGVANWIEILGGSNPGNSNSVPPPADVERIKTAVSCTTCHVSVNGPGEGLAANPHNDLGKRLASTFVTKKGASGTAVRPVGKEAIAEAAERTPILTRLAMNKTKKPKNGRATYWERLMLHVPVVDLKKEPASKDLSAIRREQARRKKKTMRDRDWGIAAKAHPLDGFLLDAKGLVD